MGLNPEVGYVKRIETLMEVSSPSLRPLNSLTMESLLAHQLQ